MDNEQVQLELIKTLQLMQAQMASMQAQLAKPRITTVVAYETYGFGKDVVLSLKDRTFAIISALAD